MKFLDFIFGKDPKSQKVALLWKSADEVDEYGISVFQRNIESTIELNLRASGFRLHDRSIEGGKTEHITATGPDLDFRVEIFRDHMQVRNISDSRDAFCMEWFDDLVPEDRYDAADEFFKDTIAVHEGRFPRIE